MFTFIRTHYSLQKALSQMSILDKAKEYGYDTACLIDDALGGSIKFYKKCKKIGIRPIFGLNKGEIYIAKNKNGWGQLLKCASTGKPPTSDIFTILGLPNNNLSNILFNNISQTTHVSLETNPDKIAKYLQPDYKEIFHSITQDHIQHIGKNNVYIGIERFSRTPFHTVLADLLEDLGKEFNIPVLKMHNQHFTIPEDQQQHKIQVCSAMKTTFSEVEESLKRKGNEYYRQFFQADKHFLPYPYEGVGGQITYQKMTDRIQDFDITQQPQLPKFKIPQDTPLFKNNSSEFLKELCRKGWKKKMKGLPKDKWPLYTERVLMELDTFKRFGFSDYFLLIWDIIQFCKKQGYLLGWGRGSSGGCLVAYLIDITKVDPIEHDLLFERFYNEGRNQPGRIKLPDIDMDVPKVAREPILEYLREKYGEEKVAQVVTYGSLKARAALSEVLRIRGVCSESEIKAISKKLPEFAKVEDLMKADHEKSLLRWALINREDDFKEFCRVKNGELVGDYAEYFEQAIRLEGTFKAAGKHAAAVIIYKDDISSVCPMIKDKSSSHMITGFDMDDAEDAGLVKFDLLSIGSLDKLMLINKLLEGCE